MRRNAKILLTGLILAGGMLVVQDVRAEQAGLTLPPQTDAFDASGLGPSIAATDLEEQSGGKQLVELSEVFASSTESNADLGYNTIGSNIFTGANTVSDDAFANARGIAIVEQNSGNQVIMQNSMTLNISIK